MKDRIRRRIERGSLQVPPITDRESKAILALRGVGFTQQSIARMFGVNQTAINRVERRASRNAKHA